MIANNVTGKTKICALIGDPVAHSVSPAMHNAAFKRLGLDYLYLPFRVGKEALEKAIDGMKALNFRGFNVTIPHKVAIIPMLDGLDPVAEQIGAVNTVVNDDGKLTGFNTDASGFLRALLEHRFEPSGKNIVILGAGGASRAISYVMSQKGAHLTILNRQLEMDWAESLAVRLRHDFNREVRALELTPDNLSRAMAGAHIVVNATSVGMSPNFEETPIPALLLKKELVVFDIVYNPVKTRLLKEAEAAGAATISGTDMLAWQGALAFEKWTGQPAPLDLMREAAVRALERRED